MQDIDNDMDDLFKRAAENYPLRVDNGDWESIARKIEEAPAPLNVILAPAKKGNKKIIVLALLLFIVSFGWYIFQRLSQRTNSQNNNEVTKNTDKPPGKPKIKIDYPGIKTGRKEMGVLGQNASRNKSGLPSSAVTGIKPINTITSDAFVYTSKTPRADTSEQNTLTEKPGIVYNNYYSYFLSAKDLSKQENQKLIEGSKNNVETSLVPTRKYILLSKDISIVEKDSANVPLKKKPSSQDNKRRLYFGLIAGPDLSKVHSRPFNFGFDAGLLLGYKINPKISLETGLIKGRKNYTSDGSIFNMDKIRQSMPAGMTINDLASQSNLIEIPLKVKYSFTTKKNSHFFVAGGLSSYIMTKEKNLYNTSVNGNAEKLNGVYYKNNYRFPAGATISAGYEHSISSYLDFKIEPFFKVPLQGVGVGSLPVTSMGLQVGVTRRLK